VPLVPVIVRV
jgi:hypothetical protein